MSPAFRFTLWAMCCIGIGLLLAALDGKSLRAIVFSGTVMSVFMAIVFGAWWACRARARRPDDPE
jgi:hypothetical protein